MSHTKADEWMDDLEQRKNAQERIAALEADLAEALEVVRGSLAVLRWCQSNGSLEMNSLDRANLYGWQARAGVFLAKHGRTDQ